ncbi:alpha-ketoacid dehydrogenase subunit alpha/beta [Rhodohalobacter sulfatireducens]|uniref:Thiamine pyrophosphate-dependent enzyme n=1 Tax=Rhodohalobacter sulfatireducens TaxID=2911366 RepID=A0ABS9KIH7_9BACT|nr:alpha-ketoacid dehydrogenase subunit alpha/beta [Rhodohalobacter sulfatireducens]MCG2590657.1 thiamine pyrophosphate-dependent enzyme [Rhodohalobacter sulfatireducens]
MKYLEEIKQALLIRKTEEKLLELYNQGKLNGTVHTCIGQEFSGVAVAKFLAEQDYVVSNHRGHGHYISRTGDLKGLFAEVMGKKTGCSGGIGGSQHLHNKNYYSNGIQGGMTPVATGLGLSCKLKENNAISVVFIGDGTLGEGILYETLNIASVWELPVLFVLENNGIAQSTSIKQSIAGSISKRAESFDINFENTNSNNLSDLFAKTEEIVTYVRENSKPGFLEIKTNRLHSHSKSDDNRSEKLLEKLNEKDFLNNFIQENPGESRKLLDEVEDTIENILFEVEQEEVLSSFDSPKSYESTESEYSNLDFFDYRGNDAIYNSLRNILEENDLAVLIGEDIETSNDFNPGEYGGAFKVSKDLSTLFPGRVRNTPISEAAIVGIGTGLALGGGTSVVEIMFGDFLTLTLDQFLQHASKIKIMYGGDIKLPLIVRTPMGGYRGYGPTHSQSIEKHFLGIPELNVIALNHRINPEIVYHSVAKDLTSPTLIIENKIAYTLKGDKELVDGFSYQVTDEEIPSLKISTGIDEVDCLIVGYGGALLQIEKSIGYLFDEEEILCSVYCPSKINKINVAPLKEELQKTKNLLIVEEGTSIASWGSELIARLVEDGIDDLNVQRLSNDTIIPCSLEAELDLLPSAEKIIRKVKQLVLG